MIRKFVTFDGEVLEEQEWELKPVDLCFYCNMPLLEARTFPICSDSQNKDHDWVTLVNPSRSGFVI